MVCKGKKKKRAKGELDVKSARQSEERELLRFTTISSLLWMILTSTKQCVLRGWSRSPLRREWSTMRRCSVSRPGVMDPVFEAEPRWKLVIG